MFRGRFKQTSLILISYYKGAPAPSKPEQSFASRVVHVPGGLIGLGDDPCSLTTTNPCVLNGPGLPWLSLPGFASARVAVPPSPAERCSRGPPGTARPGAPR